MADQQGNIKQFNAGDGPALDVSKANEAANVLSRSAAVEGGLYKQAGEDYKVAGRTLGEAVDNHEYMTEVSQGAAAGAAILNTKTAEWNKIASQPGAANDPDLAKNFLNDNLEPALEQYQNGFSTIKGQEWAQSHLDQIREHFTNKTSADMMNITGEQRVQDVLTQRNQYGSMIQQDPTAFDVASKQWKSYVDEMRKDAVFESPENSAKLNTMYREGLDEFGKEQVKALADKGQFGAAQAALTAQGRAGNIVPQWQGELGKYITAAQKARQADQDHAYIQQERAQKQQDENFANRIIDQIKPDANTGAINIPPNLSSQIFSTPGISAKAKVETLQMLDHVAKGTANDDPQTMQSNYTNLNSLTPEIIRQQAAAGKLTPEKVTYFNELIKQTPDAIAEKTNMTNAVKQTQDAIVTPAAPGIPISADQRSKQVAFTNWFTLAYQAAMDDPDLQKLSRAQRSQIVLSSTDPKGLLTPDKLKPFLQSPLDMQSDALKAATNIDSRIVASSSTATAPDVTKQNDAVWKNPRTGVTLYSVAGKWVDKDGKEAK